MAEALLSKAGPAVVLALHFLLAPRCSGSTFVGQYV
eukprot:COSAG05_NODE_11040_length_533_cov_1.769585_1_plen_35_part_10